MTNGWSLPLAALDGRKPAAPPWFKQALAHRPERSFTTVESAQIETLTWGARGRRSLVLLHGNGAHADWWSFIAPFFADDWRVIAPSWSGMGRSDWRDAYSLDTYAREIAAVAEAQRAFDHPEPPVFVAHSLGAAPAIIYAAEMGRRIGRLVLLDYGIRPADWTPRLAERDAPMPVYPTQKAALARFSLRPPQRCENLFILDHLARRSLRRVGGGWTWCFDPVARTRAGVDHVTRAREHIGALQCPLSVMWGERSALMSTEIRDLTRGFAPAGTVFMAVPEAGHHLMLDQPLALVSGLRGLFA